MAAKKLRSYPQLIISAKAARAIKAGHLWVFEGEVLGLKPNPLTQAEVQNGDLVDLFEANGTWQGTALVSFNSKIRARVLSRNANDNFDQVFWYRRASWAWQMRKTTMGQLSLPEAQPDTGACRVIFSEADGFPGLIVDRYEDVLVAQVGTVGMERLREQIYPAIVQALLDAGEHISGIYERNDSPTRTKEGLELYKGFVALPDSLGLAATTKTQVRVQENGLWFDLDLQNSQKTGFFLDQKYNRRAIRNLAHGKRVLDCFCHVAPFGLNAAAGGAQTVRSVDISLTAIELARHNAELNQLEDRIDFTCANVLEYLPSLRADKNFARSEGGPFDLIILDPPAFTKSRKTVAHASKGYRDINEAALRLLGRGGYLATCSCSQHMTRDLLAKAVSDAAHRAGVQLKQLEERQQAPDHPILWGMPETHYLDFFIFQVVLSFVSVRFVELPGACAWQLFVLLGGF